jgi:hypothetical protein
MSWAVTAERRIRAALDSLDPFKFVATTGAVMPRDLETGILNNLPLSFSNDDISPTVVAARHDDWALWLVKRFPGGHRLRY